MTLRLPNKDYLRACFIYKDGVLFWRQRPIEHFRNARTWAVWKAKNAGKPAGRIMSGFSYIQIGLDGRRYLAHRLIAAMFDITTSGEIDHRDGNGLNNQLSNLRAATRAENTRNNRGWSRKGGIAGVTFAKDKRKWQGYIRVNGRLKHLGFFETEQAAINARVEAEVVHYGGFAPINGVRRAAPIKDAA